MSPFTIFVFCIQALLIQVHYGAARRYLLNGPSTVDVYKLKLPYEPTVVSQACGYDLSYSAPLIGYSSGYSDGSGGYGAEGTGDVSAAGDIGATGVDAVDGKVPVRGSVSFGGCADAWGKVSIYGQCGCGCQ